MLLIFLADAGAFMDLSYSLQIGTAVGDDWYKGGLVFTNIE